jgi:methoxymalonate biosynthesis acyl carrier protein
VDEARIIQELAMILHEQLHLELPDSATDLLATGLLDSLAFVSLLFAIEERFGVVVDVNELSLDDFRTLSSISAYIQSHGGGSEDGGLLDVRAQAVRTEGP